MPLDPLGRQQATPVEWYAPKDARGIAIDWFVFVSRYLRDLREAAARIALVYPAQAGVLDDDIRQADAALLEAAQSLAAARPADMGDLAPDPPDLSGFYGAAMAALGISVANVMVRDHGAVIRALDAGSWQNARDAIDAELGAGMINQVTRDTLVGLLDTYGIPGTSA